MARLYNYNGFLLASTILKNNLLLHTYFKSQPSDIFLASFMKSETTWLKALMFSTLNYHRYTFSDRHLLHHSPHSTLPSIDTECYPITDFTHLPAPRLFGTHFARTLLPPFITSSCKFVYVCRDPKDVLISKWMFMNELRSKDLAAPLSLDEALEIFYNGVSDYGLFWEHVLSYWRASLDSPDTILFMKYKEMKKQSKVELRKLTTFMGKPFTVEEEGKGVVEEFVKMCSFENLSNLEVNKKGVEKFQRVQVELERRWFFRK